MAAYSKELEEEEIIQKIHPDVALHHHQQAAYHFLSSLKVLPLSVRENQVHSRGIYKIK